MDHEQKNLVRSAINVSGFCMVEQWKHNFLVSEQAAFLIHKCKGKLVSVDSDCQVYGGAQVRVPISALPDKETLSFKNLHITGRSKTEGTNRTSVPGLP